MGGVRRFILAAGTGVAITLTVAGCGVAPAAMASPPAARIAVVEQDWHTDVCLRTADADAPLQRLAAGYRDPMFLCFGFGDRQYLLDTAPGPLTLLSALLPGDGAILLTLLRDTPAAAFGADKVVELDIDAPGLDRLRAFLTDAVRTDDAGAPRMLGDGPYPGGRYFAATARYNGFYTCNTWTADALRAAGIPMHGPVLFAGGVMRQVRAVRATQTGSETAP